MTEEQQEVLDELKSLNKRMQEIYAATLQASTIVLPYDYYTEEQKELAGIIKL